MQHTRFIVLTGHLNDYPLSDLISILRHQRKTGRLLIEYPGSPGAFYFQDGNLVDAQLGTLNGIQAVCVALAQPNSSFNFNPLIEPTRYSINSSSQKVILELLGCWEERILETESVSRIDTASLAPPPEAPELPEFRQEALAEAREVLALPPPASAHRASYRKRVILGASAVGILLLILPLVIALTSRFSKQEAAAPSATPSTIPAAKDSAPSMIGNNSASLPGAVESGVKAVPMAGEPGKEPSKERRSKREPSSEERNRSSFEKKDDSAAPALINAAPSSEKAIAKSDAAKNQGTAGAQAIKVVMQIENGRVAQASVANRRPGMEAYEALALRIARQRRYPAKATGQETMLIKVNPPK